MIEKMTRGYAKRHALTALMIFVSLLSNKKIAPSLHFIVAYFMLRSQYTDS